MISDLSRRNFIVAGSAAIAAPLFLSPMAKTAETQNPTYTKIYYINHTCIGCQVCRTFCPGKAIRFGDGGNEINQKKCLHCGTCYRECPISVVSETDAST